MHRGKDGESTGAANDSFPIPNSAVCNMGMTGRVNLQELTSILAYIDGERSKFGGSPVSQEPGARGPSLGGSQKGQPAEVGEETELEESPEDGPTVADVDMDLPEDPGSNPAGDADVSPFVQTMVFSATLTLPEKLRSRLSKGMGVPSG